MVPEFEQEPSVNLEETADDKLTIPENTIVSFETQSEQCLQETADDADDTQGKLSISVELKDGTLAKVGLKVKTPDGSVSEIVWIDLENFIWLEGFDDAFSAYSLEAA